MHGWNRHNQSISRDSPELSIDELPFDHKIPVGESERLRQAGRLALTLNEKEELQ
jgi:hypothetical protein